MNRYELGPIGTNCYVVRAHDRAREAAVVDPGADAPRILEELAAFEKGWLEVLKEQSAADPTFKKVADSFLAFRETYKPWGQAQFLKSTYLGQ